MYADHHVLEARKALLGLEGVEQVHASSAWQMVLVTFNADKIKPETIEQALENAGYGVTRTTPVLTQSVGPSFKDPAWDIMGPRVTQTNELDREMSVDFKR
jgi:copper chaperone CopZ